MLKTVRLQFAKKEPAGFHQRAHRGRSLRSDPLLLIASHTASCKAGEDQKTTKHSAGCTWLRNAAGSSRHRIGINDVTRCCQFSRECCDRGIRELSCDS